MGKGQRVKGSVFEREVMAKFSGALGQVFKRHIGQARDGGHDGVAGRWVIECKRRKNLKTLEAWLGQAKAATTVLHAMNTKAALEGRASPYPENLTPLVVVRADAGTAMALLDFDDFLRLIMDVDEGVA